MSILPSKAQESTAASSSTTLSQIPNSANHGNPNSLSSENLSHLTSLQISDSGALAAATGDSGESAEKVTQVESESGGERSLPQSATNTHFQCHSGGKGVISAQSRGKMSGATGSVRNSRSNNHAGGRKYQMMNANHLLNFQYDPISRPHPRAPPPPKRHQKRKPYNKDLFLQANYKFVVLDTGNYSPESMDPDKMLQWDDIICVRYATPSPVQCPICLEYPLCPQITSCGHIFCFPCILRYLNGEEHRTDCFRRCPLCFVMISPKDLYTIYIENVKQYSVGDTIEFMLLTRLKDSFTLCLKNKEDADGIPSGDKVYDRFAKFKFTSDVDLSVREAISDLDGWLARANSGLVDDIEKLPYVCAAMEQLEQRKKYWNENRASEISKVSKYADFETESDVLESVIDASSSNFGSQDLQERLSVASSEDSSTLNKSDAGTGLDTGYNSIELEGQESVLSSSYEEGKSLLRHMNYSRDVKENNSYNFYQAIDGQHLILHPLNMKCLLHYYGSYDKLPYRLSGKILQLETVTQTDATRKRYRYLSHFSLTTTFQLCEIDMNKILPVDALYPFMDEIRKREKLRKQLAKKEQKESIQSESSTTDYVPVLSKFGQSSRDFSPAFSMDDFEAIGTPVVMSSSPPVGERKLFSSVTKLGFAAAHDSPSLKIEETNPPPSNEVTNKSPAVAGPRNGGAVSFANMMSREKPVENLGTPKINEMGKKGKKHNRVLMSTAGGRRY